MIESLSRTVPICELQFCVFSETEGIRIEKCACVSERFNELMTNSAADTWFASLDPFWPGLETESSRSEREWFSDFPLAVSPLSLGIKRAKVGAFAMYVPEKPGLVLPSPPHVVVRIGRQLKDMWWQRDPSWSSIPILCCILVQDHVCVRRDAFVWVLLRVRMRKACGYS